MRTLAVLFATALSASMVTGISCVPAEPTSTAADAGTTSTGGAATGSGGSFAASGGQVGSGGEMGQSSGGNTSGGAMGSGGRAEGSGGTAGTATSTGGSIGPGTGGRGTGGAAAGSGSGGSATGGRGGGNAGGGASGTGGRMSTGGSATGGRATGGAGTGGAATGGAAATSCNLPNHSGSGSFTFYYFGQGTAREGSGYRTACGYYGTESGTTDTMQNIASMSPASATYFAAIPGTNGFNTSSRCGACVQITGQNGRVIIATITDECPYGSDGGNTICGANPNGHLDLSKAAFDQLGYTRGDPTGTTWRFVPCPVTGNVVIRVKTGNPNELFVENSILSIASVQGATRTSYGAWHFNSNLASGQSLLLTDALGRTLTVQLNGTTQNMNQDTGRQFPPCQ